ncbi:MAG TPA: adenylate/guanylate cyclase domain-containing protein [Candidatus Limnocylindria bacterium]|nr:adenylate/guanylate cyclase domain-containing protein [Candidatus Limnocylindria bacterium]
MRELPSGTVTFLFTDVEGSTRLLHELGPEEYAAALLTHRRVIRDAAAAFGGVEVDTQGDAFFIAFPDASGALDAAERMTSGLEHGRIRVRIGVHTGVPLVTDDGYVGVDLHRAARIAAAGHGGQVLVSSTTAASVDESRLTYLGEHRLKDLAAPERVFQLGSARHARLSSLYESNIPADETEFVGRHGEAAAVTTLLNATSTRIVTLTGPGGSGKTRLAIEVARRSAEEYPHGVWWVPLADLREVVDVVPAMLSAAGVRGDSVAALGGRRLLLVLDNAEHMLPGLSSVLDPLGGVEGPRLLVTSRERLGLPTEHVWPVPPLDRSDGVALFSARARALDPAFIATPLVDELCQRLENMPLALELAAARMRVFAPRQLLDRLSERLDLLKADGRDPRQRSLRAAIEWSHDLLTESERRLFRTLSVFIGGFTLEAAEKVSGADPDTLQSLVDKSLVHLRHDGEHQRFALLETIREFADGQLMDAERGEASGRHAEYYGRLADRLEDGSLSASEAQLEAEVMNLRAAASWALARGDGTLAARILTGPRDVEFRTEAGAARALLEAALDLGINDPAVRIRTLGSLAFAAYRQGDPAAARAAADEAELLARRAGDASLIGQAVLMVGVADTAEGAFGPAEAHFTEAVECFGRAGAKLWRARSLANLGDLALAKRDVRPALDLADEAIAIFNAEGEPDEALVARVNRACALALLGMIDRAWDEVSSCLPRLMEQQDRYVFGCALRAAALVKALEGHLDVASRLFGASEAVRESVGAALEPSEQVVFDHITELVVDGSAVEEGRRLTDEQAAGLVLRAG